MDLVREGDIVEAILSKGSKEYAIVLRVFIHKDIVEQPGLGLHSDAILIGPKYQGLCIRKVLELKPVEPAMALLLTGDFEDIHVSDAEYARVISAHMYPYIS